jgi:hypothetical protein
VQLDDELLAARIASLAVRVAAGVLDAEGEGIGIACRLAVVVCAGVVGMVLMGVGVVPAVVGAVSVGAGLELPGVCSRGLVLAAQADRPRHTSEGARTSSTSWFREHVCLPLD